MLDGTVVTQLSALFHPAEHPAEEVDEPRRTGDDDVGVHAVVARRQRHRSHVRHLLADERQQTVKSGMSARLEH